MERPEHQPPRAAPIDWRSLHLWQIQWVRDVLIIAGVVLLVWLGRVLSLVTVPLLLAVLLAYLFEPLVARLTRARWVSRQGAAAAIIAAGVLLVVIPTALAAGFASTQLFAFIGEVATNIDRLYQAYNRPDDQAALAAIPEGFWRKMHGVLTEQRGAEETQAAQQILAWLQENAQALARQAFRLGADALAALGVLARAAASAGFGTFLTFFFFFFLSTGYPRVLQFGRRLIPTRDRDRWMHLLTQFDRVVSGFVRGRLVIAFLQCAIFSLLYALIGAPMPIVFGAVIGVLSIVPYLALVGIPLTILAMWIDPAAIAFQDAWWWTLGAPVVVYFLGQAIDDYVLTPVIQGKNTDMDTPSILFASLAGGVLLGVFGLLVAIPIAACVKILLREVFWPRFRAWAEGRSADPLPISRE